MARIYGIGNPLIDCLCLVEDKDLEKLELKKGTMLLIDKEKQQQILSYIKDKKTTFSCGGSCPNTMVTLGFLGIDATLAGSVGGDGIGTIYKERLKESGVVDQLVIKNGSATGSSIILLSEDKERTMNTYLGANRLYCPEDVVEESVRNCDVFYFTGYMWDTEPQKNAVKKALDLCVKYGKTVAFDVADPFAVMRNKETFLSLIETYCDIVFANKEEAKELLDSDDPEECARKLGAICDIAIIKNGKKGSFLSDFGTLVTVPLSGAVSPVDTTGAGDTYAAGFLYGYLTGRDHVSSSNIASYLAGEIISQIGAQFPKEKIKELKTHIEFHFPVNCES